MLVYTQWKWNIYWIPSLLLFRDPGPSQSVVGHDPSSINFPFGQAKEFGMVFGSSLLLLGLKASAMRWGCMVLHCIPYVLLNDFQIQASKGHFHVLSYIQTLLKHLDVLSSQPVNHVSEEMKTLIQIRLSDSLLCSNLPRHVGGTQI